MGIFSSLIQSKGISPKWLLLVLLASIVFLAVSPSKVSAQSAEIALFDSEGSPTAYIVVDDELTIYVWDGIPAAYLASSPYYGSEFSIYGFNGKHLGWFEDGIIWDHGGYAVGFIEGAVIKITSLEPLKRLKHLQPLKRLKELAPLKPIFKDPWSSMPLSLFLMSGRGKGIEF